MTDTARTPSADEAACIAWWSGLTDVARAPCIRRSPEASGAGAWTMHKQEQGR